MRHKRTRHGATSAAQRGANNAARERAHDHDPWQPTPFDEAIDIHKLVVRRKSLKRRILVMRLFTAILLVAAVIVGATPFVLQWRSAQVLASQGAYVQQEVDDWPYPEAEETLAAARAYNEELAVSGQPVLGEAVDPFATTSGGSSVSEHDDSASSKDERYQSLLDAGNGVMGSVVIPKIGVDLPIYHGTSEWALASGAGHLYGTSLPAGGPDTHSVITGHRGLVDAAMFTRLDEMGTGDFFYVKVMGETLGYQVDRITVIDPDDVSQLRVTSGEDRITLMTCTPYGVNTQRLLVSGVRVGIPHPAPDPSNLHDGRTAGILAAVAAAIVGLACVLIANQKHRFERRHHARNW